MVTPLRFIKNRSADHIELECGVTRRIPVTITRLVTLEGLSRERTRFLHGHMMQDGLRGSRFHGR